jgi:tetratricopeptide (TPR) repeat protein
MNIFKKIFLTSGIFLFFLGIGFSQHFLWNGINERKLESSGITGLIPSGEKIKPALLGFDMLGADMYWLKAVQYIGGNASDSKKESLYPLINLVTDLDPYFWEAYRFAILLLPDTGQVDETEKLIKKARKNMPHRWEPLYSGGYFYFFYKEDYEKSIEYYSACAALPECLGGAGRMVRNLETRRGKYPIAIEQYLEELQKPEITESDIDLFIQKVEESAKLAIINDAAKNFLEKNPEKNLETLQELENFTFSPSPESSAILSLLQKNTSVFPFQFQMQNNQVTIRSQDLISPFENNPLLWSKEENRVRTEIF